MVEELIKFETAKEASIKGFDVIPDYSGYVYDKEDKALTYIASIINIQIYVRNKSLAVLAPTQSLLQKWLREKHNILIAVYSNSCGFLWQTMYADSGTSISFSYQSGDNLESGTFSTYELAFEDALLETLKTLP